MRRIIFLALLWSGWSVTTSFAQDVANPPRTNFATVGRPPVPTVFGGRCLDKTLDWIDRFPCCGYGKTHNDMGVQGTRGTLIQYWGGSCEFFGENCRRRVASTERYQPNAVQRLFGEMFGHSDSGCTSCSK